MPDSGWDPAELPRRSEAMHRLALPSGIGLNTPHNPAVALNWLRKAAALGHDMAITSLELLDAEPGGLEAWFRPPVPRVVSGRSHVLLVDGFVSPALCDRVRGRAERHLARAEI